jgi:hypothetical protein
MLSPTLNITHISTREIAPTHYRSLVRFYTIRALFPTPQSTTMDNPEAES